MVGLKIKEYLDENGIKYSYLSEKTGMPMNILSPTLNGKRKMSAEEYFMICGMLGLPAETFAPDTQDDGQEQKTKILIGALFLPVFCQICLLYVLCRFSPHSIAPSVSMKYFVTFAVLVLQNA